jgi:hypothetical protein
VGGEVGVVGGSNLRMIMLYRPVCRSWCHSSFLHFEFGRVIGHSVSKNLGSNHNPGNSLPVLNLGGVVGLYKGTIGL